MPCRHRLCSHRRVLYFRRLSYDFLLNRSQISQRKSRIGVGTSPHSAPIEVELAPLGRVGDILEITIGTGARFKPTDS